MSKEDDNKAIIGRWFTNFWGKTCRFQWKPSRRSEVMASGVLI